MKTELQAPTGAPAPAAPIVALTDVATGAADAEHSALLRARAFAEPLLAGRLLDSGEEALPHADGVADILQAIGAGPGMRAASFLVYAGDFLHKPEEVVAKAFGESYAGLVAHTRKLVQIQRAARHLNLAEIGRDAVAAHDLVIPAVENPRPR